MEQNNVSFQNVKTGEPLSQKEIDEMFMRRCLQLAKNGRENAKPNPMVGAVIVSGDGRIIGEGYHVRCGEGHAEVNAFASVKPEEKNVLEHEPGIALFVPDEEPLKFYRAIAEYASSALKSGGALYFEINPIYEKETREMLEGLGFKAIDTKEDAFGKQRMMRAGKS